MKEYKTTSANICDSAGLFDSDYLPDPSPPDGDNWKLVCSSIFSRWVLWFWEREVEVKKLPTKKESRSSEFDNMKKAAQNLLGILEKNKKDESDSERLFRYLSRLESMDVTPTIRQVSNGLKWAQSRIEDAVAADSRMRIVNYGHDNKSFGRYVVELYYIEPTI